LEKLERWDVNGFYLKINARKLLNEMIEMKNGFEEKLRVF